MSLHKSNYLICNICLEVVLSMSDHITSMFSLFNVSNISLGGLRLLNASLEA